MIVLIGSQTANRKWVNYEIGKAWDDKKGLLGIYIHRLLNQDSTVSTQKGKNPFMLHYAHEWLDHSQLPKDCHGSRPALHVQ